MTERKGIIGTKSEDANLCDLPGCESCADRIMRQEAKIAELEAQVLGLEYENENLRNNLAMEEKQLAAERMSRN